MSTLPPQPPLDLTDQLSAYLDGELDAESSRQLEQRLATDEVAREELRRLEGAWRLLDDLPRSTAAPNFTATTVEMIAVAEAVRPAESAKSVGGGSWSRMLLPAAVLLIAATMGYALFDLSAPDPNKQLLENLPVVENLDAYRQVDDIEFLRNLRDQGLFVSGEESHAP